MKAKTTQTEFITAAQLDVTEFQKIDPIIPHLLEPGLYILAGAPKIGKSWLVTHIADVTARGAVALGAFKARQGPVVHLALEDGKRRMQNRLRKIRNGAEASPQHYIRLSCRPLDEQGRSWLTGVIKRYKPRLVIIDTFARVRAIRGAKETPYQADVSTLSPLQTLALANDCAIVIVHHTRKMQDDDPLNEISGTTGFTGVADGILILKKPSRLAKRGTLQLISRDLEDKLWDVFFDPPTCLWSLGAEREDDADGDGSGNGLSPERKAILAALRAARQPMTPAEVAAATAKNVSTINNTLRNMERDKQVCRVGTGRYTVAIESVENVETLSTNSTFSTTLHLGDLDPDSVPMPANTLDVRLDRVGGV